MLNRLRPVTFTWKGDDVRDVGLVAEEVAKVEPLLTFRNEKGEVEGVKYDRINLLLINAMKEMQAQVVMLQRKVRALESKQRRKSGRRR